MRRVRLLACLVILGPVSRGAAAMPTAFTFQGRLMAKGAPAEGLYDFSFRLMTKPTSGSQVGGTIAPENVPVSNGCFTVPLDFGAEPFECHEVWLEIAVAPDSLFPLKKTTLWPRKLLTAAPYAICSQSLCGTVDVSQITGLLGQGYTLLFPDVLYNRARLEMDGIITRDPVVVLVGPGADIDRIKGFDGLGRPADNPGFAMEHPFVFETAGLDAADMKSYFDAYLANPKAVAIRAFSMIVLDLNQQEFMRWNFQSFAPEGYEAGLDGRTRFTLAVKGAPDRTLQWQSAGPDFGPGSSYDPATDRRLEIDGIVSAIGTEVHVDAVNRTLTFTHSSEEGRGLYGWVRAVVMGTNDQRAMSVIELDENLVEIGRDNYIGCFPIRYDVINGFGLDTTLTVQVVLSYNRHQPG